MKKKFLHYEYANYYTEKQLFNMGLKPNENEEGIVMYGDCFCRHICTYYNLDNAVIIDNDKYEKWLKNNKKR